MNNSTSPEFYLPDGFWRPAFNTEPLIRKMMNEQKSGWSVCKNRIYQIIAGHQLFLHMHENNMLEGVELLPMVSNLPVLLPEEFCRAWETGKHWKTIHSHHTVHSLIFQRYEETINPYSIADMYSLNSSHHSYVWSEYLAHSEGLKSFVSAMKYSLSLWIDFLSAPYVNSNNHRELVELSQRIFKNKIQLDTFVQVEAFFCTQGNSVYLPLLNHFIVSSRMNAHHLFQALAAVFNWKEHDALFAFQSPLVEMGAYTERSEYKRNMEEVKSSAHLIQILFKEEWCAVRNQSGYFDLSSHHFSPLRSSLVSSATLELEKIEALACLVNHEKSERPLQIHLKGNVENAELVAQVIAQNLGKSTHELLDSKNISVKLFQCQINQSFSFIRSSICPETSISVDEWQNHCIFWSSEKSESTLHECDLEIDVDSLPDYITQAILLQFLCIDDPNFVWSRCSSMDILSKIQYLQRKINPEERLTLDQLREAINHRISPSSYCIEKVPPKESNDFVLNDDAMYSLYMDAKDSVERMVKYQKEGIVTPQRFLFGQQDEEKKWAFIQTLAIQYDFRIFHVKGEKIKTLQDIGWLKLLASIESDFIFVVDDFHKIKSSEILLQLLNQWQNSGLLFVLSNGIFPEDLNKQPGTRTFKFSLAGRKALEKTAQKQLSMYWDENWNEQQEQCIFALMLANCTHQITLLPVIEIHLKKHFIRENRKPSYDEMMNMLIKIHHGHTASNHSSRNETEIRDTALHECGHALLAFKAGMKVSFLTSVSMSNFNWAAGYAALDKTAKIQSNRQEFLGEILMNYGGIAAETVVNGDYSYGGSMDIKAASEMIDCFLKEWGWGHQGPYISAALKDNHTYQEEPIYWAKELFTQACHWLKENQSLLLEMANDLYEKKYMLPHDLMGYETKVHALKEEVVLQPQWTPWRVVQERSRYLAQNEEGDPQNALQAQTVQENHTLHFPRQSSSAEELPPSSQGSTDACEKNLNKE